MVGLTGWRWHSCVTGERNNSKSAAKLLKLARDGELERLENVDYSDHASNFPFLNFKFRANLTHWTTRAHVVKDFAKRVNALVQRFGISFRFTVIGITVLTVLYKY